jgi:opacity protein-like surface antigen
MPRLAASLLLCCLAVTAAAAEIAGTTPIRRVEVLMEGGLALPLGDLAADFESTEHGLGAETGYTLGLRLRIFLHEGLSVAPNFTYVEFGDYDGYDANAIPFKILVTNLRYGLDFHYLTPGSERTLRPFVGAGAAIVRNKYHEEIRADDTTFDAARNSFVWSLQAGVRLQDWEVTLQYDINHFTTPAFDAYGQEQSYNWNNLVLRAGFILPRL